MLKETATRPLRRRGSDRIERKKSGSGRWFLHGEECRFWCELDGYSPFPPLVAIRENPEFTPLRTRLPENCKVLSGMPGCLRCLGLSLIRFGSLGKKTVVSTNWRLHWVHILLTLRCISPRCNGHAHRCEHNAWNLFLVVVEQSRSRMLVDSFVEDEELGRTALSCHLSTDLLCQEMQAAW